jgi:hypothetical protein
VSSSDVTRDGLRGVHPGREAHVSEAPEFDSGRTRVARGEPEFRSYYGKPILNQIVWAPEDIATYLFAGGLAGASSVLAAGAQLTGRPALARPLKIGVTGALGVSFYGLIHYLGRPMRFVNMLRTFKLSSPMSVGTWILSTYAPFAFGAAASELTGVAPRAGRAATLVAGLVGPAVASYTAALIADTAVPVWHDAHRELPFVFVSSAAMAAAGLGLVAAPAAQASPARRLAVAGVAGELLASRAMHARVGELVGEPLREGRSGRLLSASRALGVAGAAGAAVLGRRSRIAAALSGTALLAASACTRFGIFEAGRVSAADPRYTVIPQRARRG